MLAGASAVGAGAAEGVSFKKQIVPLLSKYCYGCHGQQRQKAGLNLAKFPTTRDVMHKRRLWINIQDMLIHQEMPPDDEKKQPTDVERKRIVSWIENTVKHIDCTKVKDPGRVTVHRLNKAEYNNTIRDLTGLKNFRPADRFPSDEVGSGYDNIADVLSIPPLLMEKYVDAAERVLDEAIDIPPRTLKLQAEKMSGAAGRGSAAALKNKTEIHHKFAVPERGYYAIRVRAWGRRAGLGLPRLAISVDGKVKRSFMIAARDAKAASSKEYRALLDKGPRKISIGLSNPYRDPQDKKQVRQLLVDWVEIEGPMNADSSASASHQKIFFLKPGKKPRQAARKIVERFATRAFRRPVREKELDRLMGLYDLASKRGETFEASVRVPLWAVLISPHFLYRVEADRPGPGVRRIGQYEMASRLSYFLWSSMPDQTLMKLAARKKLHHPGVLAEQVRRMLKDPRAEALADNFAMQWLTLRNLQIVRPDRQLFPGYSPRLRRAMEAEAKSYFMHVIRERRPIFDFLDSNYTFANATLARHYGLSDVSGEQMQKVSLTGNRRGGVLTMAGVLTVTSYPNRTSPVLRGKWVLEQLLGTPPPPPPANVPELEEENPKKPTRQTLRQRLEEHRKNPTCASCHAKMDPIGFGLENFDAVGKWRRTDHGRPLDTAGVLPTGEKFSGPAELKKILLERKEKFARNFVENLLTYALGRSLEYYDVCAVNSILGSIKSRGYRGDELILEIVKSYPFRHRRNKDFKPEF